MANLSLYTTTAILILDTDGNRLIAKYYQPPHAPKPAASGSTSAPSAAPAAVLPFGANSSLPTQLSAVNPYTGFKEQRAFEKAVFDKTRRAHTLAGSSASASGAENILLYDSQLVVYKASLDVIFYVVGPASENELMLGGVLNAFFDATSLLLRQQVEKRALLENLDLVTLALDETVDDGIILETDSTAIASRVSRPRPDPTELPINEQTLMSAYSSLRDRVAQRILQSY
ncbi:Golgi-to-ER vesicle coat component [Tilletia horrida]|uniref:Coatomer subunit zeta n=1 Tax=Tilletia horrida TaxID=155126 RepID=A0AAN6JK36_9BASI|nr:Golgi-to-ER vesicle coat component [Tilletia horrida]KAK0530488.1 Golgi-to-ER vesicle coat component [Tilletia horrida]KAK0561798.1 Golgi-to-ER vesicle coat component [Tilletia horrida]